MFVTVCRPPLGRAERLPQMAVTGLSPKQHL